MFLRFSSLTLLLLLTTTASSSSAAAAASSSSGTPITYSALNSTWTPSSGNGKSYYPNTPPYVKPRNDTISSPSSANATITARSANATITARNQTFCSTATELLKALASRALASDSLSANGTASYSGNVTIFGMVSCISANSCSSCLLQTRNQISMSCQEDTSTNQSFFSSADCSASYTTDNLSLHNRTSSPPPLVTPPTASPPSSDQSPPPSADLVPTSVKAKLEMAAEKSNNLVLIIVIPVVVIMLIIVSISVYWWWWRWKASKRNSCTTAVAAATDSDAKEHESVGPPQSTNNHETEGFSRNTTGYVGEDYFKDVSLLRMYKWQELKDATNDFSEDNKIGAGGYGQVYKGVIGEMEIAVKVLGFRALRSLRSEINCLAEVKHKNLVKLLGYCIDADQESLVYEYLKNRSLDKFLFDPSERWKLNWKTRYNIIHGITSGLHYLHEQLEKKIIHRDLKAPNILLDKDMKPKIGDFGFGKLLGDDRSHAYATHNGGTSAYMAPEYRKHKIYSVKSDVFSYGILILEIVSGQCNAMYSGESGDLQSYARKLWSEGSPLKLVDETLREDYPEEQVLACVRIAILCVQEDSKERPTMGDVHAMLASHCSSALLSPA